jgi:glutaredoxin
MKVQLLVSDACDPCDQAEMVWRGVVVEHELDFSVVNLDQPEGRQLADRLQLNTVPALVVDGVLVAIGVQTAEEAHALVSRAPLRRHS